MGKLYRCLRVASSSVLLCLSLNAAAGVGDQLSADIIRRYQPTINSLSHHGWDHSNSVILHAMEKLYRNGGSPEQLAYIRTYVDSHVSDDGSVTGLLATLDGIHPGVLCLFMHEMTGEQKYLVAARVMRDHLLGTDAQAGAIPQTPEGGYWHKNQDKYRNIMSVDGTYMAYPFLLRYGLLTDDAQAIRVALEQTLLVSGKSFDASRRLPYHAWDYSKTKSWANPETGQSTQFWSRASGWYAMALVDMLEVLPRDHPHYPALLAYYQALADGLLRWQDPVTGLWLQVVDRLGEPDNYPEIAGSGMLTYSLAKGYRLGLLAPSARMAAARAWQGMQAFILPYSDGGLQITSVAPGMSCQDRYEDYVAIRPVAVPTPHGKQHAHGYMSVLMAASEMERTHRP